MATAQIKINGVAGSNDDLPINTLVALDNQNTGGELTFTWAILDQPTGAADALSATNIQNPTFTPKKEGTYLLQLTVNQTLPSEVTNTAIVGIRFLKTRERNPAAGEKTEDGSRGWAGAVGSLMTRIDTEVLSTSRRGVVATGAPNVNVNDVLRASSTEIIKLGLPGQENVAGWQTTNATALANVDQMLSICLGAVDGSAGPFPPGKIIIIRVFGLVTGLTGVPALVGDPIYVSDTGTIAVAPGTVTRQIGNVVKIGAGTFDAWIDGTFGSSIGLSVAAPVNVTKSPALAGVSGQAAHGDHKHDVTTAAATAISVGGLNAEGAAVSLARSDHTHAVSIARADNQETAAATFTTGAQQQVGTAGFLLALTPGIWFILYSSRGTHGNNGSVTTEQLRSGTAAFGTSAAITGTQRDNLAGAAAAPFSLSIATIQTFGVNTNVFIGGTTTAGTVTVQDRELIAIRLV